MSWTRKYWDLVDQFYWAPQYLGMKSIPKKHWRIDGNTVCIPKEMTNPGGPLYRRVRSGDDYWNYVRRQEETFNHIFDLTFAIMPGDVVSEIFGKFTQAGPGKNYKSLGREIWARYQWGEHDNVTTPDGLFISNDSVLAIELKFNAKTSLDQLAKYMMLLVAEEIHAGIRDNLDLLYIFRSDPKATFEGQTGFQPRDANGNLSRKLIEAVHNEVVRRYLEKNESVLVSVVDRLNINCISWSDLSTALVEYSGQLRESRGDRTLRRLITGFAAEIGQHPFSNVSAPTPANV